VIYAGSSWAMLVVLAKLGTPELVGVFALALAVTAPVIMFANLQMRTVQATDSRHEYRFSDYFILRLCMLGLALLVITVVNLISGYEWKVTLVILVVGLGKAIDAISDVIYGLLQQHELMNRVAVSMILKGILSLIALTFAQYLTHDVFWAAVGWSLASTAVLLFYDIPSGIPGLVIKKPESGSTFNLSSLVLILQPSRSLVQLLKFGLRLMPLGLASTLASLNMNIPRYFIQHYLGERELGIFAALSYAVIATTLVANATSQAVSPRLAKYYCMGDRRRFSMLLVRLIAMSTLVGAVGLLIALFASKPLLTLLYQVEYAEYSNVFWFLMMTAVLLQFIYLFNVGMIATRQFVAHMLILVVCLILSVIFSGWLIPHYALMGAAWVMIGTSGAQLLLSFVCVAGAIRVRNIKECSV
jgi:O-antigen/teichoic acid export membrane protein